jgi:urease accessory protein UreF
MFLYLESERVIRVHKWCIKSTTCHRPEMQLQKTLSAHHAVVFCLAMQRLGTETKNRLYNFVQQSHDKLLTKNVV